MLGSVLVVAIFRGRLVRREGARREAATTGGWAPVEAFDVAMTPAPSNPFCWSALALRGAERSFRRSSRPCRFALRLLPPDRCALEPTGKA